MILASFTDVYLPTLSTIATLLALLTLYFARRDRREERRAAWQQDSRDQLRRLAAAVVDLVEAARTAHLRSDSHPFKKPLEDGIPPSMIVPRMRLVEALAGVPLPSAHERVWELCKASQAEVIRDGEAALVDLAAALHDLTVSTTKERLRRILRGKELSNVTAIIDALRISNGVRRARERRG